MRSGTSFWHVFEQATARFGDLTAVEVQRKDRLEVVRYRELRDMATAIAAWLHREGVRPGDRCAILSDNDAHWIAAYLGMFRLGAVAVPLDTNYSAAQVATIAGNAGATWLFAGPRLLPVAVEALASLPGTRLVRVHGRDAGVASLDDILAAPDTGRPPECPATADDPAVILYTSGTTSDPKGVVLSHGNLSAERAAAFAVVDVNERDSILGVLPLFHALAQMANLLLPLAVGARVVFLETLGTTELLRALAERQITIFVCVPQFFYLIHQRVSGEVQKSGVLVRTLFRSLLSLNLTARKVGLNLGPTLFARVHRVLGRQMRLLVTGGSKFDPKIGRDLYGLGFSILQAYGLTETSGAATVNRIDEAHIDTVGRILPGNELRIMPPEGDAEDGEVAIRGPIVMCGYYNRPDATSAVMRDGWFLTGDLGRIDDQGRLTITGRKKEVIVLSNGKNIYPEEIEAHYRQSPYVKEICVMGLTREDEPTAERLFAVIVPNEDALRERKIVNAGDWLRFELEGLAADLPPTKRVLGYDIWFEPLPRTTTGKLKRFEIQRRMKDRERRHSDGDTPTLSAADQAWLDDPHASAALVAVRRRAKPGATVLPGSNLELDLGLDSMERVELLAELEQQFGVSVPETVTHEIFTVRQLVDAVRPDGSAAGASGSGPAWATILRDLPPETDPVLSGLLEHRPVAFRLIFAVFRLGRLLLPRLEVRGLEHLPANGPYIICPNHQSFLDPFVLASVLPYRVLRQMFVVGAAEYFRSPLTARLARTANCVPVDADSNLVPAMKAGAFGLSRGKVLLLFPEGERSIDGTVKRFKKGAPILATHIGVPMVPVALKGLYELWPRNRRPNWSLWLPWSGHRVRVAFDASVRAGDGTAYADTTERLRDAVSRRWDAL